MRCPFCKKENDKVIDSRSANDGLAIRRRRECEACSRRYTTYERLEEIPLYVIKKDQRREIYDRAKVIGGIHKACEKRPVSLEDQDKIADDLEKMLHEKYEKEVSTRAVGEFIMQRLAKVDQIAYVRFASVYREFQDVSHFMKEIKSLLVK
jgi:transcriptional repressor NrdR